MTLLFPLMWPVILTQSWTGLEINPILEKKEMTVFIWKAASRHFQRYIWKLVAFLYEVTFAVDKIGQDLDFKQVLVHGFKLLIFYSFNRENYLPWRMLLLCLSFRNSKWFYLKNSSRDSQKEKKKDRIRDGLHPDIPLSHGLQY